MELVKFSTTDEYIGAFSGIQKKRLQELRRIVKQVAPAKATEVISYNMPALKLNKVLVYYAAYAHHIGFYPTSGPIKVFAEDLKGYKTSKGAIQFPLTEPLPAGLIKEIISYRIAEDEKIAAVKQLASFKK
ncbi:MAG: DUF1801 domain-containing protein [Niabella sp.]|nr:DUF1801 domain-containing protein [Niabella sp.]